MLSVLFHANLAMLALGSSKKSHEVRIVTLANCTAQTLGKADSCERSNANFVRLPLAPSGGEHVS